MSSSLGDFGTRCERVKSGRLFTLAARHKSFITNPQATVSVHTSVNPAIRSPLLSLRPSRQRDGRRRVTSSSFWKAEKNAMEASCVFLLGDIIMIWFTGHHLINLVLSLPNTHARMHASPGEPSGGRDGLLDILGLKSHSFSLDSDSGSWRHEPES